MRRQAGRLVGSRCSKMGAAVQASRQASCAHWAQPLRPKEMSASGWACSLMHAQGSAGRVLAGA